ncbi:hypothetical protein V8E36_002907 [Tilletia maclaganii]
MDAALEAEPTKGLLVIKIRKIVEQTRRGAVAAQTLPPSSPPELLAGDRAMPLSAAVHAAPESRSPTESRAGPGGKTQPAGATPSADVGVRHSSTFLGEGYPLERCVSARALAREFDERWSCNLFRTARTRMSSLFKTIVPEAGVAAVHVHLNELCSEVMLAVDRVGSLEETEWTLKNRIHVLEVQLKIERKRTVELTEDLSHALNESRKRGREDEGRRTPRARADKGQGGRTPALDRQRACDGEPR